MLHSLLDWVLRNGDVEVVVDVWLDFVWDIDGIILLIEGLVERFGVEFRDEGIFFLLFGALFAFASFVGSFRFLSLLNLVEFGLLLIMLLVPLLLSRFLGFNSFLSLFLKSLFLISPHLNILDSHFNGQFDPLVKFSEGS